MSGISFFLVFYLDVNFPITKEHILRHLFGHASFSAKLKLSEKIVHSELNSQINKINELKNFFVKN